RRPAGGPYVTHTASRRWQPGRPVIGAFRRAAGWYRAIRWRLVIRRIQPVAGRAGFIRLRRPARRVQQPRPPARRPRRLVELQRRVRLKPPARGAQQPVLATGRPAEWLW